MNPIIHNPINSYDHALFTAGKCGTDDFFNEDEVVAGDVIVVDLDVEVSKTIHEAAGLWNDLVSSVGLFQVTVVTHN